ncbi:GIN domain-containing protein [Xenorhabdus hominickii]|uniref:Putative auto-transporter adhesin head GIN domain-containing protein n=1 Tax=Xenorhabdus hominickii TaxID=351679 RepID=A0A2G0Q099_XENHO|nr:DUF2807 domain-containing protein [Xenorhabdus hominickii]AOM42707.1 hypothetical protein A9255_20485 [Xenorhabdus hominickii]PHM52638.1 hypothetical protein Xhom_04306 [Xenorhabdus hominickii]
MKKTAIFLALISGATFHPALAAEKNIDLKNFTAVNAQKGIKLMIQCAETPSIKVKGTNSAINKLYISQDGNTLNLINEAAKKDNVLSQAVKITLYTNQPLNNLTTKAGVKVTIPACAVDSEQLEVSGEMGSKINIEGKTKHLDLVLNMGAMFNELPQNFSADSAKIHLSMGAKAFLCNIPKITGNLTAGTQIAVNKQAVVKTTDNFASEILRTSCD